MAIVLALQSVRVVGQGGRKVVERVYTATWSGSYSGTGAAGEPLDFTSTTIFTNPNNLERSRFGKNPTEWGIMNAPPGYTLKIVKGTALATGWGLRVFQSDDAVDPLDELANGAYPAGVTGATDVQFVFRESSI